MIKDYEISDKTTMFLGNLIADLLIGGISVGILSVNVIHALALAVLWSLINVICLFTFQRYEFNSFSLLVKKQELKYGLRTTWNHKIVLTLIRISSSFLISLIVGIVIIIIKNLFI